MSYIGNKITGFLGSGALTVTTSTVTVEDDALFSADGNTIIGNESSDTLTIKANTVAIPNNLNFDSNTFFLDASNNRVGIGTSSPVAPLHIFTSNSTVSRLVGTNANGTSFGIGNTTTGAAHLYIDGSNGDFAGADYVKLIQKNDLSGELSNVGANPLLFSTTNTERMRITSAGQVGIGTSSPNANLGFPIGNDIKISQVAGAAHQSGNAGSIGLTISDGGNHSGVFVNNSHDGTYSDQFITFNTAEGGISASTERMRITSSGNVGIGTSSNLNDQFTVGTSTDGFTANVSGAVTTIRLGAHDTSAFAGRFDYDRAIGLLTYKEGPYDSEGSSLLAVTNSGQVGIGDSNPLSILHVGSGLDANVPITLAPSTGGNVEFRNTSGTGTFTFTNANGSSERMRIDSSGNVGIGTSSPLAILDVKNATNEHIVVSGSSAYGSNAIVGVNDVGSEVGLGLGGSEIEFYTGATERMRIDSSGNVLVGTTDASPHNNSGATSGGIALHSDSYLSVGRYNGAAMFINRQSNDGDIIDFRKDGTTVGSIGVENNDRLYIDSGSGNTGIRFDGGAWIPRDNGAVVDGTVDLGSNGARLKDLHLSGGVYVGGTGAANHLDDYEEGTWTPYYNVNTGTSPTYTYATQRGRYTKIGNLVIAKFEILTTARSGSSTNALTVNGLPFTVNSYGYQSGAIGYAHNFTTNAPTKVLAEPGTTRTRFYYATGGSSPVITPNNVNASSGCHLYGTVFYRV